MSGQDLNLELIIKARGDQARAEIAATTASVKSIGAEAAAATKVSAAQMQAALQQVGGDIRKITPEMLGIGAAATTATEEVAAGARAANEATNGLRLTTSGMIQEYVRMTRAIATGQFDRLPSEFATAASRAGGLQTVFGGLSVATLGVVATGAALAAGLGYLVYEEIEANKQAEGLAEGFALTGRAAQVNAEAIQAEIDRLRDMPHVTTAAARAVVEWESAHAEVSDRINYAVDQLLPQFVEWMGKNAPKAVDQLKEHLSDIASGPLAKAAEAFDTLNRSQLRLNGTEAQTIIRMIESGDRIAAVNRILGDLATQGGAHLENLQATIADTKTELDRARDAVKGVEAQMALPADPQALTGLGLAAELAMEKVQQLEAELRRLNAASGAGPVAVPIEASDISEKMRSMALDVSKTQAQVLQQQIGYLQQEEGAQNVSAVAREFIEKTLAEKRVELARRTSAQLIETDRTVADEGGLIGEARINAEIAADRKLLADARITADDKLRVAADLNEKLSELHQHLASAGHESYMQAARDELAQLEETEQVSDDKRLGFELEFWQKKLAALQAGSKDYGEVLRAEQALQHQIDSKAKADAKHDLDAQVQATDEAKRREIEGLSRISQQKLLLGQITAQQEIAQEEALENQLYDTELKGLQDRLKLEDLRPAEAKRIDDEIEALEQQHQLKMTELTNKAALAEQQAWEGAFAPIGQGFSQTIQGMLQRTQTLQQGVVNILSSVVMQFVDAGLKGVVSWAASEAAKTTATASGTSLRMALQASESTTFIGRLIGLLAGWLGLEGGKTAATTTGVAARTVADTTAATTSITASKLQALSEIPVYTGIAAMGAASAVAAVPIVGPGLALAAAHSMEALGATELSIASALGGYWELPSDQLIMAHEREMVLPPREAGGLRSLIEGGGRPGTGASSRGGDTHHWNFSPTVTGRGQSTLDDLRQAQGEFVSFIGELARTGALKDALRPAVAS